MSMVSRRVIYPSVTQLPEIFFSNGSLGVLKNISSENILLVLSKSISTTDTYSKLKEKTLKGKIVKEEIITNAKQETILEISKKYSNWPPDTVLAIGGGIVLDSAKLIRHFLSFPEDTFENLSKQFVSSIPHVKLISIPSTPNTGSESNNIAVTINSEGRKVPFINKSFLPDLAILDPVLLQTIPKNLMFDFCSDIITHAYEGSISRLSNNYLQNQALNSMMELEKGLFGFKDDPSDLNSLEMIQYAGHEAGIVAGNAFVGMIHALGHSLETIKNIGHGSALHSIFQQCLEWQKENIPEKRSFIDQYLEKWQTLGLSETADKKILKTIDANEWANLSINDPSIKTDQIKFSNEKLLDVISWIQNNH